MRACVVLMGRAVDRRYRCDGQTMVKPRLLKFNFEIEILIFGIDDNFLGNIIKLHPRGNNLADPLLDD